MSEKDDRPRLPRVRSEKRMDSGKKGMELVGVKPLNFSELFGRQVSGGRRRRRRQEGEQSVKARHHSSGENSWNDKTHCGLILPGTI